jgi:type IV secretory pathway VirD2 relaxase
MDPPEQRARTLHDGGIQHWPEGVRTFVSIMPDRLHFAREVLHDMVAELQRSAGERMEWHAAQHNHQGRAHWHVAINGQRSEKDIARALHRALEMRAERAREWAREQRARERAPRSLEQALAREMERGRDDVGMER